MARVYPALKTGVILAPIENGYLAFDPASKQIHELNPIAALITELCDGHRSVDEIRDLITSVLPEGAPLPPEGTPLNVAIWIEEAVRAGLLISNSEAAAPAAQAENGRPKGGDSGSYGSSERSGGNGDAGGRALPVKDLADLAVRLRKGGKVRLAFQCQQTVVKLTPDDGEAWCYLGELAHIVGRRDDARAAYEKYLTFEPDDAEVKHILLALRDEAPPSRAPDEFIQQLYERFSSFYDSNLSDLDFQGPDRIRELADIALGERALGEREGLAVLDLGCGTGLAGVQLKPRAARMTGIDLSPHMVELARARNVYDQLEVAEITNWLARDSDSFDLIAASDCLIYFGDLRQVIAPAARRLNPGGAIVFTVERGERYPFHLTDSGRYAHHPDHLREIAAECSLHVAHLEEGFLRMEYGSEVTGLFAAFKRV